MRKLLGGVFGGRKKCFAFIALVFVSIAQASPVDWQGEYGETIASDAGAAFVSSLSLRNCTQHGCHFDYSAGAASACAAQGDFEFKAANKAIFSVEVKPIDGEGPRGACLLTFERRDNGHVFVDANDVFKSKSDKKFGAPCKTLCGAYGATDFAIELPKLTSKNFFNPSYSCLHTNLTTIEMTICTTESLSTIDRDLAENLSKIKSSKPNVAAAIKSEQKAWLKKRNTMCAVSSDVAHCLTDAYKNRLAALEK